MAAMKKILILRFSAIGDIVLTSPVIRCLKTQTKARVHFATKKAFSSLAAHNPYIDQVHVLEESLHSLVAELQKEQFDLVIDLHNNLRTLRIKRTLGVPATSFPKYNFQKWVLVNFKLDFMPKVHIVDRYFQAVADLGVQPDEQGLDFFIPDSKTISLETLPKPWRDGFYAFVIGGSIEGKMCNAEKIARICKAVNSPVVLFGGPEDQAKGDCIVAAAGELVFNSAGSHSLLGSASLLRHAHLVVTHDTGLMHIAAAFGKTIISLWGGTVPALGMTPYKPGPNSQILEVPHLMRPPSKLGKRRGLYKLWDFMEMIPDQSIVKAIQERLP
jgi:ADP-heptose:LPS heptosyltransferase